jgi:hypothetical protein
MEVNFQVQASAALITGTYWEGGWVCPRYDVVVRNRNPVIRYVVSNSSELTQSEKMLTQFPYVVI